jgi:AraC-like DNA-binding protein
MADLDELRRLRRARDRMDREFAQPLDVPALARTAFMSPAHFSRRFREAYGETPYSYLMTRRIERAKSLLRRGDMTVTDACFAVGCTSLGSFSARFTELVGETPSAYRARDHSALRPLSLCEVMVIARDRRARKEPSAERSPFGGEAAESTSAGGEAAEPTSGRTEPSSDPSSFEEASVLAPPLP